MTCGFNKSIIVNTFLPDSWKAIPLSIFSIKYGDSLTKQNRSGGAVPVYGSNGIVGWHTTAITNGPAIIIGRKGSVGAIHISSGPCWPIDTTYYIDEFPSDFDSKFLYYFLRSQAISDLDTSTAIPGINRNDLENIIVPQPPLDEQRRIVVRLESILAQTRAARESLERVPELLKAFRRSVLAAAFRGELTERNPDDEPASALLERIRAERRRRWEESQRAKGKDPAGAVYEEPPAPDTSKLPELPEGWVWTKISAVGEVTGGLTKNANREKYLLRYPYISVINVYADELRLSEINEIGIQETEIKRTLLQQDDLLIVEGNGSVDQIGRAALWDGSIENCLHQNHIIKVRFYSNVEPRFILYWLLSPAGREAITRVASSTSGLYTLSISKVTDLPVPLPVVSEQKRIVMILDTLFKQCSVIEKIALHSSHRLDDLEQSAMTRAFRGEL